jgi:hypothetical protein
MHSDPTTLVELRGTLARALGLVDQIIAGSPSILPDGDPLRYRRYPGGPLSEAGVVEVIRRLEEGQSDSTIALAMGISLVGAAKRRAMWRRARRT